MSAAGILLSLVFTMPPVVFTHYFFGAMRKEMKVTYNSSVDVAEKRKAKVTKVLT